MNLGGRRPQQNRSRRTLTKIQYYDSATPIAPVVKKTESIRIRGDIKVTLNPLLMVYLYSLSKINDIFVILNC